jgi:peptidoglycan/LPS O-acetylase OafA/YrhL
LIDALRGLAAFWVVLFHVRVDLWVGFQDIAAHPERYNAFERMVSWLSLPASFGGSGVMLFFLVSGFCIHLPHVDAVAIDWKPYLARRFWRIYPPYAAAVILTLGCELLARTWLGTPQISSPEKTIRTLLMSQNYGHEAGQMIGNAALWPLPVEFELYLAYPIFLWVLRRFGAGYSVFLAASASIIGTVLCLRGQQWMEGNFVHYWLIWCSGALLAEGWQTGTLPPFRPWYLVFLFGTGAMGLCVRLKDFSYPIQHYVWAVFYFLLFWAGLRRPSLLERLPDRLRRGMVWVGLISYSLYLIHYPIFLAVGAAWNAIFGSKPVNFLVPLMASFLILPLAWVFNRFTEVPSHNFGRKMAKKLTEPPAAEIIASI